MLSAILTVYPGQGLVDAVEPLARRRSARRRASGPVASLLPFRLRKRRPDDPSQQRARL
jgi:hypothetical protein